MGLVTGLIVATLFLAPLGQQSGQADELRAARNRWESMTEEERRVLVERWETFRKLEETRRGEIERRSRELDEMRKRQKLEVPKELKRELAKLAPAERRERMRKWRHDQWRERGRRVRDKLPPEWVERLEAAQPGDRPVLLERLKRKRREEHADRALDDLARRMRLPREMVDEIRSLPQEQRMRTMMELRRRHIVGKVERSGLPPFVSNEEWEAWLQLPLEEFNEKLNSTRQRFEGRMGRKREPRIPAELQVWHQLRTMLQPERVREELGKLPPRERRAQREAVGQRLRDKALRKMREMGDISAEDLARFEALEGNEFREELRSFIQDNVSRRMRELGRPKPALERQRGAPAPNSPKKSRRKR